MDQLTSAGEDTGDSTPPLAHLTDVFNYNKKQWSTQRYHYKWNITKKEIEDEIDRQMIEGVSFTFVLKWLQNKNKKS